MDVTSLLNTAGSATTQSPTTLASPAITESGHTIQSSTLSTPSPERILAPLECTRSPRQSLLPWNTRGYSIKLAIETRPRSGSIFSCQTTDGRTDTEITIEPSLCGESRNNSVCSEDELSASSTQSPRTITSRHMLRPSINTLPRTLQMKHDNNDRSLDSRHSNPGSSVGHPVHPSNRLNMHFQTSGITKVNDQDKQSTLSSNGGDSFDLFDARNAPQNASSTVEIGTLPACDEKSSLLTRPSGPSVGSFHKRTMSAPDIAHCSVAKMPRCIEESAIAEPRRNSVGVEEETGRESVPTEQRSPVRQDEEAYCMFVKNCDTGSQLRKAISHLFGRNKACTLRIPKHVWVYYCRKHYQRIRYRNAKTYPLNQMELVKLQIMRLQAWSEENRKQQKGAYIRMWALSLRKREQSRIENGGPAADDAASDARGPPNATVSDWLIQRVGSGYTTEEILDVAERLHEEIRDGKLAQVPEIEFLPDIVDAESGPASKSARGRRHLRLSSSVKLPKRKAPESLDLPRRDSASLDSRGSNYGGEDTYETVSPSGKRARVVRTPVRAHTDFAKLPSLASALSYGEMQPPPPVMGHAPAHASNVVPRNQPMEYRGGSQYHGPSSSYGTGFQAPRWDGYESPPHSTRSEGSFTLGNAHGDYRHGSESRLPHPQQHQTLPPISTQFDGRFPRSEHSATSSPERYRQESHPAPYRTSSLYTPNEEMPHPVIVRSSSSGHDMLHRPPPHYAGYSEPAWREDEHSHLLPPHRPEYRPDPRFAHNQLGYTHSWPPGRPGGHPHNAPPPGHNPPGHTSRHVISHPGAAYSPPLPPRGPPEYAAEAWYREDRAAYSRSRP